MKSRLDGFKLSLITASILTLSAQAASPPWVFDDGQTHEIIQGHQTDDDTVIPLHIKGENTVVNAPLPLAISSSGEKKPAALLEDNASLNSKHIILSAQGDRTSAVRVNNSTLNMTGGTATASGVVSSALYAIESNINISGTALNSSGKQGNAIHAENSQVTLNNVAMMVSGNSSLGMIMRGGDLKIDGGALTSKAALMGLNLGEGAATIKHFKIGMHQPMAMQGIWLRYSELIADDLNITMNNNADPAVTSRGTGLYIENKPDQKVHLLNSRINTQATSITMMGGENLLENVTATSTHSHAVDVNTNSVMRIIGGHYENWAEGDPTIWVASKNAPAFSIDGARIISHGTDAIALSNQGGGGSVTRSTLNTHGDASYGLYSDVTVVTGDSLNIETAGKFSAGVVAARGGTINLSNSQVMTQGDSAAGLIAMAGSQILAEKTKLITQGKESWGMRSTNGDITLRDSALTTKGEDSAAIYSNRFNPALPARVLIDHTDINALAGDGLLARRGNLDVRLLNGTTLQGERYAIRALSVKDNKSQQLQPSSVMVEATNGVKIRGDVQALDNSQLQLKLLQQSTLSGAANGVTSMHVDQSSRWNITGNSQVDHLHMAGDSVFSHSSTDFHTLTVNQNLTGGGTFTLNTQLGDDHSPSDRLRVKGSAEGIYRVVVNNVAGTGAATENGIPLIHVAQDASAAQFNQQGEISIGNYEYFLNKVSANDWYLQASYTPEPVIPDPETKPEPGGGSGEDGKPAPPSTLRKEIAGYQIASWMNANYAFTTAGTLHERQSVQHRDGHAWGRIRGLNDRLSSDRFGYRSNTFFMQLGGDFWQSELRSGLTMNAGVMGTLGTINTSAADQARLLRPGLSSGTGKLNTTAYSVGGYATFVTPDAGYLDLVAQQSVFSTNFNSSSNAQQRSASSLLSAEIGQPWAFVDHWQLEPQFQLMGQWFHAGSTGKDGVNVNSSNQMLGLGRAGLRLAWRDSPVQPYVQIDVMQRLGQVKGAEMTGLNVAPDVASRWWKSSLGFNSELAPGLYAYAAAEYQRSFARSLEGYSGNLGIKYQF